MLTARLTRLTLRALDSVARILPGKAIALITCLPDVAAKRRPISICDSLGYVMVARNYRSPRSRSELDLVGWDGDTLCFIEVKTRTTRAIATGGGCGGSGKAA